MGSSWGRGRWAGDTWRGEGVKVVGGTDGGWELGGAGASLLAS